MRAKGWQFLVLAVLAGYLPFLNAPPAHADNATLLTQLRANLSEKPSSVRESLLPGLYGVYFNSSEPRTFVDRQFTYIGNQVTGYMYLSGSRRGQDLTAQESQQLFRDFLAAIPRAKLIVYHFGTGRRVVFLFTAYDCPNCRALEREFLRKAKTLNATIYLIPTSLQYSNDIRAKPLLRSVLCAADPAAAWKALILKRQTPVAEQCPENPDDYAFLSRSFPVKFPLTVPTAVTLDGHIYPMVLAKFDEVFRGK
ncbi:putative thiol:disulfide interchange protein DsbC precursor [mine drainage metagenome]|uniref:Putative thiol:disulfide interchange protein DsbC n=1 Tax=mine drainage metagenome TaxID=410659 RepID=A0A1J5RZV8_9ZZZZ